MKSLLLKSPAKLNLLLKVNFKRPDGYHDLTTLFERIDLCDEIRLRENNLGRIRIFCNNPHVPKGTKNLCFKAAQLLQDDFSVNRGVDIKITKRIPVAAGLGGGSGNAATVLLGLNRLWKLSLSKQQLAFYAQKIGSDVPFFIFDCRWAIGTQRGDKIQKLPLKAKFWHVLVVPRLKVYTREIFGALNLKLIHSAPPSVSTLSMPQSKNSRHTNMLTKKKVDVNILHRAIRKNDLPKVGRLLLNDLETALVQFHPNLLKIKGKLKKYPTLGVLFSGSGPAVFGLVQSKKAAERIKAILGRQYRQVFVVRTY